MLVHYVIVLQMRNVSYYEKCVKLSYNFHQIEIVLDKILRNTLL